MSGPVQGGALFADLPATPAREHFQELHAAGGLQIKRIVSPPGYSDPPGAWYDQDCAEWVIVLAGSAMLRIADEATPRVLARGDYLHIPAHVRHRIERTDAREPTVWLAVYHH
jgi:cupin 2 domain-containing protein